MQKVLRLARNTRGRDFVVGDLHGCYDQVLRGMDAVKFDQSVDRLIADGDLIDRGADNHRAVRFLRNGFVYSILGNHEEMLIDLYADGEPPAAVLEFFMARNGFGWWRTASDELRADLLAAVKELPIVIETSTERGTVGFVHAEVPIGMDWATFTAAIEAGDKKVTKSALWGRVRANSEVTSGVAGIGRVFVGHTPQARAMRLGNVYYVDTGVVFGVTGQLPEGHLTFANLNCATVVLTDPTARPSRHLSVRHEELTSTAPFGQYLRK